MERRVEKRKGYDRIDGGRDSHMHGRMGGSGGRAKLRQGVEC